MVDIADNKESCNSLTLQVPHPWSARGHIHTQVATLNVNMAFGGGVGVVDLDARIVAKWYFFDFNVKRLYHMSVCMIMQLIFRNRSYENVHYVGLCN